VASAAAAEGLWSVAAGVHPFSHWEDQTRTAGERYQRILERYGRVIRTEHIFGMHIHVAVPVGIDRVVVMNRLREFIPHLLALSASSPFYEG
jgi:carboxylate-amine ligase